ncbi:MAG: hypothetical protein KDL87_00465 [Verrucomicrobiae bacterium]|nr:hypothetical protein [Verrucomicrobiae bacterium]
MTDRRPVSFLNRPQLAGLGVILLTALVLAILPTCELARTVPLHQPLELFLLSDRKTEAAPLPYSDPTGAITGYLAAEPGLRIDRVQDVILETKRMPVFVRGRVTGKQSHRFARLLLLRRDQPRLEAFTQGATGSVLLVRMNGHFISTRFLTEPLTGPEFVISGPDSPEMLDAIRTIQASISGAPVAGTPGDK